MRICVNVLIYSVCAGCQTYCADFLLGTTPTLSFQVPLSARNTDDVSHGTMGTFGLLPECCDYETKTEHFIVTVIHSVV
jgi:hypothetical protein